MPFITREIWLDHFSAIQTFILDSPSRAFTWGNPRSFVVVAPRNANPGNREAFTNSVIDVLRSEKDSIGSLTVESFAAKVHAAMYD